MSTPYEPLSYSDELLADGAVCRRYTNGVTEWRWRNPDQTVRWQADNGHSGIDELLGDGVLKRTLHTGQVLYGREQGYGRTAWSNHKLTINESSFGGRVGAALAGVGAGFLLANVIDPPITLSAAEEEELRQQAAAAAANSGSSGGGGGVETSDSDFGDSTATGGLDAGDADFG